jgi:hypothetical protein
LADEALRELYEEKREIEGFIERIRKETTIDRATRKAMVKEFQEDLDRVKKEILEWH